MGTNAEERMIEALYRILDELEAIHENTNKAEPFCCATHGYTIPIVSTDPADGTQVEGCSACVRSAP